MRERLQHPLLATILLVNPFKPHFVLRKHIRHRAEDNLHRHVPPGTTAAANAERLPVVFEAFGVSGFEPALWLEGVRVGEDGGVVVEEIGAHADGRVGWDGPFLVLDGLPGDARDAEAAAELHADAFFADAAEVGEGMELAKSCVREVEVGVREFLVQLGHGFGVDHEVEGDISQCVTHDFTAAPLQFHEFFDDRGSVVVAVAGVVLDETVEEGIIVFVGLGVLVMLVDQGADMLVCLTLVLDHREPRLVEATGDASLDMEQEFEVADPGNGSEEWMVCGLGIFREVFGIGSATTLSQQECSQNLVPYFAIDQRGIERFRGVGALLEGCTERSNLTRDHGLGIGEIGTRHVRRKMCLTGFMLGFIEQDEQTVSKTTKPVIPRVFVQIAIFAEVLDVEIGIIQTKFVGTDSNDRTVLVVHLLDHLRELGFLDSLVPELVEPRNSGDLRSWIFGQGMEVQSVDNDGNGSERQEHHDPGENVLRSCILA
jgi:hypothetical protein